jgi:predicted O-methyltransferase YrrM
MDIVNQQLTEYMLGVTPKRDPVIQEMEKFAASKNFPIIGPLVGRMLYTMAKVSGARRILELGSGFGYSACWFAKALGKGGEIFCTEGDPENAKRAMEYFRRAKVTTNIHFMVGDALQLIDQTTGKFDIILNDIDKHEYPAALRKALPRLRKGGLLITDNVLWSGRILNKNPDANTAGILKYNNLVYSSKELFTTIIPLRDGVAVSIKR